MTKLRSKIEWSCVLGLMFSVAVIRVSADDSTSSANSKKIPAVTEKAPDFTLNALNGQPVTLSKLLAKSPVVLVVLRGFPGYQCPICATQVSGLIAQAQDLAGAKAQVLLVYPGPGEKLDAKAGDFLNMKRLKGMTLPEHFSYVTDPDYRFTLAYGLRWNAPLETAYPSTFVIDQDGVVRYSKVSKTHGDRAPVSEILKALGEMK